MSTVEKAKRRMIQHRHRKWNSAGWLGYTRPIHDSRIDHSRWFDATTGRWISLDPTGFTAGDTNTYRYVGNSPADATDPTGLANPDRGPFIKATPAMPKDWEVHHVAQRADILAGRFSTELGVDVHDLGNLRGVPPLIHHEINGLQTKFWNGMMKKYGYQSLGQAYRETPISEIQKLNTSIESVYKGLMVEAGAAAAEVAAVQKSLGNKALMTVGKSSRIIAVLSKVEVALGVFALFSVFTQNAALANNIANPPPNVQASLDAMLTMYGRALSEAEATGQLSQNTWGLLGDKLSEYMNAAGFDDRVKGTIMTNWATEGAKLP